MFGTNQSSKCIWNQVRGITYTGRKYLSCELYKVCFDGMVAHMQAETPVCWDIHGCQLSALSITERTSVEAALSNVLIKEPSKVKQCFWIRWALFSWLDLNYQPFSYDYHFVFKTQWQQTPLHLAVTRNKAAQIIKLLLSDDIGRSMLHQQDHVSETCEQQINLITCNYCML